MIARWLAAFALVLAACSSSREVELHRASALYTAANAVTGHFYVDGTEVATCSTRWAFPEIVCDLEVIIALDEGVPIELAIDGVGVANRNLVPSSLPEGRQLVMLASYDDVHAAVVELDVRIEPILPMRTAVVLYVLAGIALAFVAWAILRARFLTPEDGRFRRSVSIASATVATILAWIAMFPLADLSGQLDPTVLALPSGLGAYALTAIAIDGFALRRGGRRVLIAMMAAIAIPCLPVVVAITLIPPKYLMIGAVIAILLVLT